MISRKNMTGAEITSELERRKGSRPSPGTIYPALKDLKTKKLVDVDVKKRYVLTKLGHKELEIQLDIFFNTFSDVDEMKSCCGR